MTILSFPQGLAGKINRWGFALLAAGILTAGSSASAQRFPTGNPRQESGIPSAYRPPAGMCRIWIDGVPPSQQPAPTDCVTAVRNRPVNGWVIFGDAGVGRGSDKPRKGKSKKDDSPFPGL